MKFKLDENLVRVLPVFSEFGFALAPLSLSTVCKQRSSSDGFGLSNPDAFGFTSHQ